MRENSAFVKRFKQIVKRTPLVRDIARAAMARLSARSSGEFNSADYWDRRYQEGRNSGAGSYNRLALFKADVVNRFVKDHRVASVIEFGCGDGSQLTLADYPAYIGVDVSPTILAATREKFAGDPTKIFVHTDEVGAKHLAELALSLDVVYHLVEDEVFERYMTQLFDSASRFVIIYSSNDDRRSDSLHVRHRRFTDWVGHNRDDFRQTDFIENAHPEDIRDLDNTSFANFYIFEKLA